MIPALILASASPRRRDLFTARGYDFTVQPADVEETAPPYLTPGEIVLRNAQAKARSVAREHRERVVVGVDTVVAFEGEVFGKPADMEEAVRMLARLNGHTHEVYSGVFLVDCTRQISCGFIEITRVHFHRRSDVEMRAYLERIGPLDKAGSYAAQDDRGGMIHSVEGSFTNVVGLPMETLEERLKRMFAPGA